MLSNRRLFTVAEVAEITALSERTVYSLMYAGKLESVKVGACRRVTAEQLETFLASLTGGLRAPNVEPR